jgi:hypothetical protein
LRCKTVSGDTMSILQSGRRAAGQEGAFGELFVDVCAVFRFEFLPGSLPVTEGLPFESKDDISSR